MGPITCCQLPGPPQGVPYQQSSAAACMPQLAGWVPAASRAHSLRPEAITGRLEDRNQTRLSGSKRQPRLLQRPVAFIAERCRMVGVVLGLSMEQVCGWGCMICRMGDDQGAEILARLPPAEFYAVLQMQDIPARAAALALALAGGSRPGSSQHQRPQTRPNSTQQQQQQHQEHHQEQYQEQHHRELRQQQQQQSRSSDPLSDRDTSYGDGGGSGRDAHREPALNGSGSRGTGWSDGQEEGREAGWEPHQGRASEGQGEDETGMGIGVHDPRLLPSMLRKCPSLLVLSPWRVGHRAADLSSMFGGLAPRTAALLLQRCPTLLLLPNAEIRTNLSGLASLLSISPARMLAHALQQPNLLKWTPSAAAEKLEEVAAALGGGLTRDDVAGMCGRQPSLMAASAERLAGKLQQLAVALALPQPPVTAWMASSNLGVGVESGSVSSPPGGAIGADSSSASASEAAYDISHAPSHAAAAPHPTAMDTHGLLLGLGVTPALHLAPASIKPSSVTRLPVLAKRASPRKRPQPAPASPTNPSTKPPSSSAPHSSSPPPPPHDPHRVHQLVRSYPALLTLAPATIRTKLNASSRGLQLHRTSVQALVLLNPGLLTLAPAALPSRAHSLCEILGGAPLAVVKAALLSHPWLMTCPLDELRSRCSEWALGLRVGRGVIGALFMARPNLLRAGSVDGVRELCGVVVARGLAEGLDGALVRLARDDALWDAIMSDG
ncbi:MAG: hypothetical protein WDW38_009019 [Sanguina aurantia]